MVRSIDTRARCFRTVRGGRQQRGCPSVLVAVAVALFPAAFVLALVPVSAHAAGPVLGAAHYAGLTGQGRQVAIEPAAGAPTVLFVTSAEASCPGRRSDPLVESVVEADVPLAPDGAFFAVVRIRRSYAAIRVALRGAFWAGR